MSHLDFSISSTRSDMSWVTVAIKSCHWMFPVGRSWGEWRKHKENTKRIWKCHTELLHQGCVQNGNGSFSLQLILSWAAWEHAHSSVPLSKNKTNVCFRCQENAIRLDTVHKQKFLTYCLPEKLVLNLLLKLIPQNWQQNCCGLTRALQS